MKSLGFTAGNQIDLLHCGAEFFPALIYAIDHAQAEIYLETYIFASDATAGLVKEALIGAARRGVVVKVTVDWIGTGRRQCAELCQEFSREHVFFQAFNPWFERGIARMHRKLCLVDRKSAFLGGLNINDDMLSDDDAHIPLPMPRWDFGVRIEGPLVRKIFLEMETQWTKLQSLALRSRWELYREKFSTRAHDSKAALAALVVRDNLRNRRTIQKTYLKALGGARESVLLANPYFAPGRKLRNALASAAKRGVKVTLLLGVGQFRSQDAVAHAFYPNLLKHGVRIVEYRRTQLHGKVAVVDEEWATVGSSNYDGFSLFVNHEANIVVRDAAFAAALRKHIEQGISDGVSVDPQAFVNIPWYRRLGYGVAYLLYKNVLRVLTFGKYLE
ncbi:MAG: putative phospholipase D/transphosphatidylase [Paucimonas sp.]|jgi:cardiolipin synthase|nr:putative phospholipase D/transphosphatidylase [Paucimonas sp.]